MKVAPTCVTLHLQQIPTIYLVVEQIHDHLVINRKTNQLRMSRKISENAEDICAVCRESILIFAVGQCDHVVCMKCSTRMRALCNQMYCPICRADLPEVWYLREMKLFEKVRAKRYIFDPKLKVHFEDAKIEKAFEILLEHKCSLCKDAAPEKSFLNLKTHMRKDHTLFYCDICVQHLKIFSSERKCYTRQNLATHRRTGDLDDRSHKGHPICQFCDERYLDNDELLRHLRKEHYYCHFCDHDGSNQYYSDYDLLQSHFRDQHFLCEEGDCSRVQFVNAFQTEIDLKAHRAAHHATKRSQARQERTLDLEFNYNSRQPNRRDHRYRGGGGAGGVISRDDYEEVNDGRYSGRNKSRYDRGKNRRVEEKRAEVPPVPQEIAPDTKSTEDFPEMTGANKSSLLTDRNNKTASMATKIKMENKMSTGASSMRHEDFPELPEGNPATTSRKPPANRNMVWSFNPWSATEEYPALQSDNSKKPGEAFRQPPVKKVYRTLPEDQPKKKPSKPSLSALSNLFVNDSLPSSDQTSKNNANNYTSNKKINMTSEKDFPSLGGRSREPPPPPVTADTQSWTKPKKSAKSNTNENNTASRNQNFSTPVDNEDDFPSLGNPVLKPATKPGWVKNDRPIPRSKKTAETPSQNIDSREQQSSAPKPSSGDREISVAKSKKSTQNIEKLYNGNSENENQAKTKAKKNKKTKSSKSVNIEEGITENGSQNNGTLAPNPVASGDNWKEISSAEPDLPRNTEFDPFPENKTIEKSAKKKKVVAPSFDDSEFPALNGTTATPSIKPLPPPGLVQKIVKAPPGLKKKSAPPGFAKSSAVRAKQSFVPPQNSTYRNQQLIADIQTCLRYDPAKFDRFKILSGQFRQNVIDASEYYTSCCELVGNEEFSVVFTELLVLLPDIVKQQDLLVAYMETQRKEPTSLDIKVCSTCQQILLEKDLSIHQSEHDNQFPALGL
ncbi:E3 ubiquitin-protein ligase ZNF598-like [Tubulanus polymorphus]|uniref:E3 ubiquitin-protein ligase ZNF598-like n=1 Tax=Tubulanus polymorphus TaxID=672921 RepID=UPI003DA53664